VTHPHTGHCYSVCKGRILTGSYVSMGAWGRHTAYSASQAPAASISRPPYNFIHVLWK